MTNAHENHQGYDLPTARKDLEDAVRQADEASASFQYWEKRKEALSSLVAGLEGLAAMAPSRRPLPLKRAMPGGSATAHSDGDTGREGSFRGAILKVIADLGDRRGGLPRPKLVAEAKVRGLQGSDDDEQFDKKVQYALNGLKAQEQIRSAKRGSYKVVPAVLKDA